MAETTQVQSQVQTINISVESSGDIELERRIFRQVHSAGRQLKRLSSAVAALIDVQSRVDASFGGSQSAQDAVAEFRQMQTDILKAKAAFEPERVIAQLEALRQTNPAEFAKTREQLANWLHQHQPAPTS